MKLSTTMQNTLNSLINAPFAEYGGMVTFHTKDGYELSPSLGKCADGTIDTLEKSGTLRALEKRGLIEIIKDGGKMADKVRLLQHENKQQPVFETRNFVAVEVFVLHHKTGNEIHITETEYVEDGVGEYAKHYWSGPMRNELSRVVEIETGKELYNYRNE